MSTNGRPSMAKRQKEMARQEKQREKAVKRVQRATTKEGGGGGDDEGMEVVFGPDGTPLVDGDGNIILVPANSTPAAAAAVVAAASKPAPVTAV
jgi:hypothetical protein